MVIVRVVEQVFHHEATRNCESHITSAAEYRFNMEIMVMIYIYMSVCVCVRPVAGIIGEPHASGDATH